MHLQPWQRCYEHLHTQSHTHTLLEQAVDLLHPLGRAFHFVVPTPARMLIKSLAWRGQTRIPAPRHPSTTNSLDKRLGRSWGPGARWGMKRQGSKTQRRLVSRASPSPPGVLIALPAAARSQAVQARGRRVARCRTAVTPEERPPAHCPALGTLTAPGKSPRRRKGRQTRFSWGCQASQEQGKLAAHLAGTKSLQPETFSPLA